MDVVILCGGLGTRLRGVVSDRPKPMADVAGRPFLEWLLISLRRQGVRSVVLATGHLAGHVEERIRDGHGLGIEVRHSREDAPLGTGGALRRALRCSTSGRVAVLNGDTYSGACLADLERAHERAGARGTMLLARVERPRGRGVVRRGPDGWISSFDPDGGSRAGPGIVNAGTYVFEREVLQSIPDGQPFSLEAELLTGLAGHGLLGILGERPLVDIGLPEAYAGAGSLLAGELAELDAFERSEGEQRRLRLTGYLGESIASQRQAWAHCADSVLAVADLVVESVRGGGRVLLCGNGGAAAAAQHLAAEFVGRLSGAREREPLPAIALTGDSCVLTALGNDYGFEAVFERQVRALGRPGDVLLALSVSGASPNVLRAAAAAREAGLRTAAFCGDGGPLRERVDCAVAVPGPDPQHVQEVLLPFLHALCQLVEQALQS
jgi:D-sedoheptulose 7-phosphate isomerase